MYVFLATPKLRSPVSVKSFYDHKKPRENPEKTQKTQKKSKEYQITLHTSKNRELSLENTALPLLMQILESPVV